MAYINVEAWNSEQTIEWIKGLDYSMYRYLTSFTNNQINGNRLLNIRPYELEELGITCIGHQEIILEALDVLKNFHYNLDKENLQYLALQVATSAHSLYRQLSRVDDQDKIETSFLKDITRLIGYIKKLVHWIDKPPFAGQTPFNEIRDQMLKLGLEIATCGQRDRFTKNPVQQLHQKSEKLAKLADCVIQNISDPMLLTPSTLDLVTLKKRESELGFYILPTFYGIHKIYDIKFNSPAHNSNKIEEGDEIVQINYQTVVGWHYDKVMRLLRESTPDVLLTIRKRPRHQKMYGQVYIKPYRLPSKKRTQYRWGDLPSPRGDFLSIQEYFPQMKPLPEKPVSSDSELSTSDTEVDAKIITPKSDFYNIKIHRRHSICCDGYSMTKATVNFSNQFSEQRLDDSPSLRDKSVSFGFGLEMRPTTHLGIGLSSQTQSQPQPPTTTTTTTVERQKPEPPPKPKPAERKLPPPPLPPAKELKTEIQQGVSKIVRFDSNVKLEDSHIDTQFTCNIDNTVIESFVPIPYADEDAEPPTVTAIPDLPPAIEPRQSRVKPVPPPRPTKTLINPVFLLNIPPPPPLEQFEPPGTPTMSQEDKSKVANVVDLKKNKESPLLTQFSHVKKMETTTTPPPATPPPKSEESLELYMTNNSKSLTLKKKNSLISKRRKAKASQLTASSDIQGHLFRRTKSKQGASYWAKLYVLLIDTALYGFKSKNATKADFLIFLPGFTVNTAQEVHSKSFAFKVYHPNKTFYFAAETEEAQKQWIDYIHHATLKVSPRSGNNKDTKNELFSETDSSDDEFEFLSNSQMATPSPSIQVSSPKSASGSDTVPQTPTSTKSEGKYHLGFGSLKKSLRNLNSSDGSSTSDNKFLSLFSSSRNAERKNSADMPVPTSQFKSYRKMPVNVNLAAGVVTLNNPPQLELPPPSTPKPRLEQEEPIFEKVIIGEGRNQPMSPKPMSPKPPINYMHASNPNLLDFQTFTPVKPVDFLPVKNNNQQAAAATITATTTTMNWDGSQSLSGFVTLKDLMLQKQAEDAKEMYNKRVCLGIEKSDDRNNQSQSSVAVKKNSVVVLKNEENVDPNDPVRTKINKIQLRSLPVTPDYVLSFKPEDKDILYTRSREGQKLRDFGYELITGDDRVELKNNLANAEEFHQQQQQQQFTRGKKTNKVAAAPSETKKRGMNWIHSGKESSHFEKDKPSNASFSLKKSKNKSSTMIEKLDHLVASREKLFHFKHNSANDSENMKQKQANTKPSVVATNWNLVDSSAYGGGGVGGSGADHNEKSGSYLTKLTFSNKTAKEKKLLGSPRLHRAIFGNRNNIQQFEPKAIDHEVFLPMNFSKSSSDASKSSYMVQNPFTTLNSEPATPTTINAPASINSNLTLMQQQQLQQSTAQNSEYPDLEFPPIFEAEIYSLSDLSSNILKRRHQNLDNK